MRVVTFDIETQGAFSGPLPDLSQLKVALVGVHDSESGNYSSYLEHELGALWPLFERADVLVGYNSDHFDIPILNKYYPGDLTQIKSIDLLKEIKNVLGRRLKLDNLAEATLGKKKSGSGLEAARWWEQGLVEKVREYCLDDVRLTRALYDHAREHGFLKYKDFSAPGGSASGGDSVRDIKLDTSLWETLSTNAPALTHTLPF